MAAAQADPGLMEVAGPYQAMLAPPGHGGQDMAAVFCAFRP